MSFSISCPKTEDDSEYWSAFVVSSGDMAPIAMGWTWLVIAVGVPSCVFSHPHLLKVHSTWLYYCVWNMNTCWVLHNYTNISYFARPQLFVTKYKCQNF
jgi:hypothetical protein